MTSINPIFSVQKYDGLEEMIPMMYHIEYKSTLRNLKSLWWWCGRVIIVSALSLSEIKADLEIER